MTSSTSSTRAPSLAVRGRLVQARAQGGPQRQTFVSAATIESGLWELIRRIRGLGTCSRARTTAPYSSGTTSSRTSDSPSSKRFCRATPSRRMRPIAHSARRHRAAHPLSLPTHRIERGQVRLSVRALPRAAVQAARGDAFGRLGHPGAISRARVTYRGARTWRRSATSDSRLVVDKRRARPTLIRVICAAQSG